jgi:hypothetical protein
MKDWRLKRHFGIGLPEYRRLVRLQEGLCAICGEPPMPGESLSVDHDHETGMVRGLLCRHCNIGLGKLGDTIETLLVAVEYLRHPPAMRNK